MGMPVQETPSTLHAGYSSGDRRARPCSGLEEVLDRLVGQAGEPGEARPPTEEWSETPREREDHLMMRDGFKNLLLMRSSDGITLQVGATRARHDETCRVGVEP